MIRWVKAWLFQVEPHGFVFAFRHFWREARKR
jgi:hypothetical protein